MDDRSRSDPVGGRPTLAGFLYHPSSTGGQRRRRLAVKARVKRDGKWINPAARDLVPGDIILVCLGDIVPPCEGASLYSIGRR